MFGLRGVKIRLFQDSELKQELSTDTKVDSLSRRTIFITPQTLSGAAPYSTVTVDRPVCHYVNVEGKGQKGTLLLENPRGEFLTLKEITAQVRKSLVLVYL